MRECQGKTQRCERNNEKQEYVIQNLKKTKIPCEKGIENKFIVEIDAC